MRLDLFLRAARLCQRRSVAQKLCEAGLVLLNDKPSKPAHMVKPGDSLTIRRRDRLTKIRVLSLPASRQISRSDVTALYEMLSEECDEPVSKFATASEKYSDSNHEE